MAVLREKEENWAFALFNGARSRLDELILWVRTCLLCSARAQLFFGSFEVVRPAKRLQLCEVEANAERSENGAELWRRGNDILSANIGRRRVNWTRRQFKYTQQ